MDAAVGVSDRPAVRRDGRQIAFAGYGVAGLAAVAVAATVAGSGAVEQPALVALARALMVGAPIAVGLYAWRHGPDERFGRLLIAAGAGWFVTTLAESGDELLYTVGRTAGWLVEVLLVYLILCFPTGKLRERTDRLLVGAMAAVVAAFFLPRLVLAKDFEVPSPFTSCTSDCPANGLFALDSEPALVDAILRPAGVVLVFAVMVAVVLRLWQRIRGATPWTRRMLTPVLAIAMAGAGALAVAIVARHVDPTAWPVEVAAWLLALAVPAIALTFLAGLLRWRLFAERALRRLAEWVRGLPDAVTLRRAFAEAFDDPTVEIVFPASSPDGRWMDCWGHPAGLPRPGTGRSVSEVRNRGSVVAAIVHDEGLGARPELVQAGVSMAGVVLDNQRLAAEAQASLLELKRSRARIAAGAAQERRRIERDLHDGAQQRLVALRIELELAEDLVRSDPERGVARLRELERGLDDALEELRALAHGVYPPLLADRGLVEALRAAATRSIIPVELAAHGVGRFRPEVESAVYFCILEALQNALKHARGARRVVVRVDSGPRDQLRFSVRDDGAGTPSLRAGAGITNMRDRLAAVGGDVEVASTPRVGTVVRGSVPTLGQPA
jgi:signal transduction histidine kinase